MPTCPLNIGMGPANSRGAPEKSAPHQGALRNESRVRWEGTRHVSGVQRACLNGCRTETGPLGAWPEDGRKEDQYAPSLASTARTVLKRMTRSPDRDQFST